MGLSSKLSQFKRSVLLYFFFLLIYLAHKNLNIPFFLLNSFVYFAIEKETYLEKQKKIKIKSPGKVVSSIVLFDCLKEIVSRIFKLIFLLSLKLFKGFD
jgi:hypothetical protein